MPANGDRRRQLRSESAAIGLYLADRYSLGVLAPKPDEPARGTYLRNCGLLHAGAHKCGSSGHARRCHFAQYHR